MSKAVMLFSLHCPFNEKNLPTSLGHIPEEGLVLDVKLFHAASNPEFVLPLFVNQQEKAFLAPSTPETNMKKRQKAPGSFDVRECNADVKLQQMCAFIS